LDVVALVRGGTILPTYLLVTACQPFWPFHSHEVLATLHLRSTLRSFPGPPPPQGWQGPDRCPRSFARRIAPSRVRVGTPGHHRGHRVVLLPPLRHFSIDLADGCTICTFILWSHADYYEGSVALGLAPDRRSRLLDSVHVTARVRCPVRPVKPLYGGRSPEWKASEVVRRNLVSRGSSERTWYRGVGLCTAGDWGSGNPAFTLSCGSRGATSYTSSDAPRFDGMLRSPLAFAAR
jgi:hypothetical protein